MSDNGDGKRCGNCVHWARTGMGAGPVVLGETQGECRKLPLQLTFVVVPAPGGFAVQGVSGYPPAKAACAGCGEFKARIDVGAGL